MGVGVDDELGGEEGGEEGVDVLEALTQRGELPVVPRDLVQDLRLDGVEQEVLPAAWGGVMT